MCKTISINPDLTWVGALDPNLRIFDIIMDVIKIELINYEVVQLTTHTC